MIHLGNKIRELRKAKGLTQEQFASSLNVSPQAVSKWEMGGCYPDMAMIPILANFFDVSLDTLFDFDITKKTRKIDEILQNAGNHFWRDFDRAEEIYLEGIREYPAEDKLKTELLTLYECHIRSFHRTDLFERAEELAHRLIGEVRDVFAVCSVKESLISLYIMKGKYNEAKTIVESLPYMYPYMLNDRMRCASYHLKGEDRLAGAKDWKIIEQQELFIACDLEGRGYFEIGDYTNALESFYQSRDIIERFMTSNSYCDGFSIDGTAVNCMVCYLAIAGCLFKLGESDECNAAWLKARDILEALCTDEEEGRTELTESFLKVYDEFGLTAYHAEPLS